MQNNEPQAESMSTWRSRAADLPQELFEDIAWHAASVLGVGPSTWNWSRAPSKDESMHSVCTLSLVSTYFAPMCRPHIFRTLQFYNAKQMRGFLTLMEASPTPSLPHISTFVQEINVEPMDSDNYWIHQLATALLPKLKRYCNQTPDLTLWLKGHGSLATPRTMMPLLARAGVRSLYLRNMAFHRGEELSRILATFPALYDCTLISVALDTLPDPVAIWRNLPNTSLRLIAFHECTPAIGTWLICWLICCPSQGDIPPWDTEDAEAILELTRIIDIIMVHRQGADIYLEGHGDIIEIKSETFVRLASDVRRVYRTEFNMFEPDKKSQKDVAEAALTLGRTLENLQEIEFNLCLSDLEDFVTAFHATLQQAVGSTRLTYYHPPSCRYIDPQLILSKSGCARFLGTESGWCRSTGRGAGSLVCIPTMVV